MKNETLTVKNIKEGLEVVQKKHPEFGTWRIGTDLDGSWTVEKGGWGNGKRLDVLSDYQLVK